MKDVDQYYLRQEEPVRSVLLAIRELVLSLDPDITNELKYGMPFFCYRKKMFCYCRKDKKSNEPYIGIVEGNKIDHPLLEKGNRSRMKILRINPAEDLPKALIEELLYEALELYKNGTIKIK